MNGAANRWPDLKNPTRALGLLVCLALLPTPGRADEDGELWGQIQIARALTSEVAVRSAYATRYRDGASHLYYERIDLGLSWRVTEHLMLGTHCARVNTRSEDRWAVERRPYLDAALNWDASRLRLSDRSMVEWRISDSGQSLRYRNKLTVAAPGLFAPDVRPYVAGEVFYDLSRGRVRRHRAYAGLRLPLGRPFLADIYYLRDARQNDSGWTTVHVAGTKLVCHF